LAALDFDDYRQRCSVGRPSLDAWSALDSVALEIATIGADVSTADHMHDGDAVKPLQEQVEQEVNAFYGDGAYDQGKVRDYPQEEKIDQVIPPQKNAVIQQHGNYQAEPLECDECLR
jgi:hypothetical protein